MLHRGTTAVSGFTLIELLVTIAIIAILANVVLGRLSDAREQAFYTRAQAEFRQFATALEQYRINEETYPDDVDRGIPPGLEAYLSGDSWPDAPWRDSVYDWDNWTIDDEAVVQLSIRFCPIGGPLADCNFPDQDWAEDFAVNSSVFYCFEGPCRSHDTESRDYPGYCVNCDCKEMATCHEED